MGRFGAAICRPWRQSAGSKGPIYRQWLWKRWSPEFLAARRWPGAQGPPQGTGPGSTQKNKNQLQTEQFCFMKAGLTWAGLVWAGLGCPRLARAGLGWAELAWACLAWPGLAWAALSWTEGAPCGSNLSAMAAKRGAEVSKATCFTARANGAPPINTCQMRGSTPTLPPWPTDGALRGSNLSAMAAKCGAEVSKVACFTTRTKAQPL